MPVKEASHLQPTTRPPAVNMRNLLTAGGELQITEPDASRPAEKGQMAEKVLAHLIKARKCTLLQPQPCPDGEEAKGAPLGKRGRPRPLTVKGRQPTTTQSPGPRPKGE